HFVIATARIECVAPHNKDRVTEIKYRGGEYEIRRRARILIEAHLESTATQLGEQPRADGGWLRPRRSRVIVESGHEAPGRIQASKVCDLKCERIVKDPASECGAESDTVGK